MSEWKLVCHQWIRDTDTEITVLMDEYGQFKINIDPLTAWLNIDASMLWRIADQVHRAAEGEE